jgi:AbrB family looped-hinge helix DNA binding protein
MSENVRYEVITQEDPETGDLIIPIPIPVLKKMGWKEGDEVSIDVDEDGQLYLKKADT